HELGELDDQVDTVVVRARADLARPHADRVGQPAVPLVLGEVDSGDHDLAAAGRVGAAVAPPVEHHLRTVLGLDHALEVGAVRAVGAPPRVVGAAHPAGQPAAAGAFGDVQIL